MGFQYELCVTYSINANVAIKVSDSQQKYVVLSAMRRSGGISKNLLMKKLKSKVYVSFLIRLYFGDAIGAPLGTLRRKKKPETGKKTRQMYFK